MDYVITKSDGSEALYHHGIKGQRWGVRKYQNEDGSLTEAGKIRYEKILNKQEKNRQKMSNNSKRLNESLKEWDSIYSYKNAKTMRKKLLLPSEKKEIIEKNKKKKIRDKAMDEASTRIKNNKLAYKNARLEAKKDNNYKKTKEYYDIKKAYSHDLSNKILFGRKGAIKAGAMESAGYKKAGLLLIRNNINKIEYGLNYDKLAKKYG